MDCLVLPRDTSSMVRSVFCFCNISTKTLLHAQLTSNTLPTRPLANRDIFIVQDYVRVPGGNGGSTSDRGHYFYTYNHDIDHPYFAHRPGFVRMKVKNQGLVGTLGDEGKTRLTWLVNMDPGGVVPSAFVNGLLVGLMATPFIIVEQTEEYLSVRKGGDVADLHESSPTQEEEEEGKGNRAARESAAKLKLKAELAEMKAEMARKDEELRRKDEESRKKEEELQMVLAEKDEELKTKEAEIQQLRRRLPRSSVVDSDE